ncbi:Chromosome initiation inhibitor [hydrothermal vent metagenome]|uniref:Chromosome initiation inhibitor n=1 Tax=hydrothermal vent metagenome TaxID=652676 RepID=A0A3B1E6F4_9ZZZZ
MLSDFTKIHTFLIVAKEKSFSKASAKLGISQPAVTQQMKFIEKYLNISIINRKKNGIKLTKEGEQLLVIAQKIEKTVINAEQDLLRILNKDIIFMIGASYVVGNYILPTFLNEIKEKINNDVSINVDVSSEIIDKLKDKQIDMALIETPIFEDGIIYREWIEDEIVIFSNQKFSRQIKKEDLLRYKWVCRDKESHTRKLFKESLERIGFPDCDTFDIVSVVSSPTTIVQTILHSSIDGAQTVSIVSKYAIDDLVKAGTLFATKLPNLKMKRKLYIAYLKERKHDPFIDNVINYLNSIKGN